MSADRLPPRSILSKIALMILLSSCAWSGFELAPPEWIQGVWQSEPTVQEPEYVRWEFTADNAIYEFHDPEYDIHSTIDLRIDFAGKWVRDQAAQDDWAMSYYILIDRVELHFLQFFDEAGAIEDPSVIEYNASGMFFGGSWNLQKQ